MLFRSSLTTVTRMGRPTKVGTASLVVVCVLAMLAACSNDQAAKPNQPVRSTDAAPPNRLELRPVLALLPPDDRQFAGNDLVLPSRPGSGSDSPVRYAVGPVTLTGHDVAGARAQHLLPNPDGWVVIFRLNDAGTAKLNRLARAMYNRQPPENAVAIVVDGVVQSAPAFRVPSFTGDVQISGNFTESEARALAAVVGSGGS